MAQRILGLDIGATTVKAVVVESTHHGSVIAATARAPIAAATEDGPALARRQLDAIEALLAESPVAFDSAIVSLPGTSASHVITLPFTDTRRIEQTIGFEVEAQIPFDLAAVAWDWQPLHVRDGKTELLVAVVKKDELASLLTGLGEAGVDPRAVIPPGPAYAALFASGVVSGGDPAAVVEEGAEAILDVGASRTSVCVARGGNCEASRTFVAGTSSSPSAIAREVRATLRAWRARSGGSSPALRRMLLAGEAARIPGLMDALAPEVEGPIEPLALKGAPADAIPAGDAPTMALALALALRGLQSPRVARLNLRRADLAYKGDFEHVRGKVQRLGAWAGLVILLAMVSSGVKVFALSRQEKLLDGALCDATTKLVGKCYTNDELAVAALRGKGTAAASIPKNSALDIFTELSLRNPQGVTLRYDRIEITRDKIHLQGTTDAAENVDKIVTALRASRCFGDARSGGARKRSTDGKFEFTVDSDLTCDTGEKPVAKG